MFITVLFAIAKIWKQPKCPSTDEWIKMCCAHTHTHTHTHHMILFSHKKNEILPFATTWMDPEDIKLSEISQTETNTILFHSYMESKK